MATVFASAERTQVVGTYESTPFVLPQTSKGMLYHLVITAETSDATLDLKLQYFDDATATWEDYKDWEANTVSFPQKTGVGEDDLVLYEGGASLVEATHPAAANRRYASPHPRRSRWVATVGDDSDDTITFSLASTPLS